MLFFTIYLFRCDIQFRLMTCIVDGNTNGLAPGVQGEHAEVAGDDLLDHHVTVLDPPAPSSETKVFVERFIRMICVIQQSIGSVNVVCTNYTI